MISVNLEGMFCILKIRTNLMCRVCLNSLPAHLRAPEKIIVKAITLTLIYFIFQFLHVIVIVYMKPTSLGEVSKWGCDFKS